MAKNVFIVRLRDGKVDSVWEKRSYAQVRVDVLEVGLPAFEDSPFISARPINCLNKRAIDRTP